ncbi:MAG TPA: phosphate signaling complex protein PhoU [Acidobacteriaceae bacterium]|nr:phosphate signaling complex protein PhoU [Acidobacteriaceae bacterium]
MPRIHYQQRLAELKNKLLAMAALAQQTLGCAMDGYMNADMVLLHHVQENETAINAAQRSVDEMAYDLMAMEQPMAIDLRFLLAVIKINGDLERIGDQSVNIAERAADLLSRPAADLPVNLRQMSDLTEKMIRFALQSLLDGDAAMAKSVLALDDDVDQMNRDIHKAMITMVQQKPQWTAQALSTVIISRNLERIADHATNIAEDVIFWVHGADVRHHLSLATD